MDPKNKDAANKKISERSSKIEEQIKEAQKRREDKLFLEELGKRISIARDGKMAMEKGDYSAALASYRRFLTLTAKAFKVEVEGLKPDLFDEKNRASESILISAVFLDLMKMLDKLTSGTAKQERASYHRLFVRFTVGQPFQGFSAENLRRYISTSKTLQNKKEFQATYAKVANQKFCFVATWAFENESAAEVVMLRNFRDEKLLFWPMGKQFVRVYYFIGPTLVRALMPIPHSRQIIKAALTKIIRAL